MKIDFVNLQQQYKTYSKDLDKRIYNVIKNSNFIMGKEINELEKKLENFTNANYAITCSSGTDALILAMMAINIQPGDEIITTPFTWISTAETIAFLKAKPVFVDIEYDTFNINTELIEAAITKKTKAIMPVSLFGQPADLKKIQVIANKYNLKVIIDGAQSFGSKYNNIMDSTLGNISITSFFPTKPLGCYGDGGAVFTNNKIYAERIKMLRIHGQNKPNKHKFIGIGGRLDTIQAAILLGKLPYFSKELKNRQKIAELYSKSLSELVRVPTVKENIKSSWAQYTIRVEKREKLKHKLEENGIPTSIYYPIALHLQECFRYLKYKKGDFPISEKASREVISLPMNSFITKKQIKYIASVIRENI